jgi:hypothetical protein
MFLRRPAASVLFFFAFATTAAAQSPPSSATASWQQVADELRRLLEEQRAANARQAQQLDTLGHEVDALRSRLDATPDGTRLVNAVDEYAPRAAGLVGLRGIRASLAAGVSLCVHLRRGRRRQPGCPDGRRAAPIATRDRQSHVESSAAPTSSSSSWRGSASTRTGVEGPRVSSRWATGSVCRARRRQLCNTKVLWQCLRRAL